MSEPLIFVDPANPTPPYEQVRRQLLDLVQAGTLRTGDRLPSLRQLAGDLGLAVGTVARAYSELESAGVVVSRRGAGTRIAPGVVVAPARLLDDLATEYVAAAKGLGADTVSLVDAVRRAADTAGSGDTTGSGVTAGTTGSARRLRRTPR